MSGSLVNVILALVAGAIGGNVVGAMLRQYNLGPLGNSIAGILGGGLGGELLSMILSGGTVDASGVDSFLAQIIGGGIGGGLLMAIVGILRQTMGGPTASA